MTKYQEYLQTIKRGGLDNNDWEKTKRFFLEANTALSTGELSREEFGSLVMEWLSYIGLPGADKLRFQP